MNRKFLLLPLIFTSVFQVDAQLFLNSDPNEAVIGHTTYDNQSNASVGNRIFKNSNGNIAATWNQSFSYDLASLDRGTGYNFFDLTSWQPIPTTRVESNRVGWPNITILPNGKEYMLVHGNSDGELQLTSRSVAGTGAWTENITQLPGPTSYSNYWPRLVSGTGGANGNTLHAISITYPIAGGDYNGQQGALCYSRSINGGQTWNIINQVPNELNSNYYPGFDGDAYCLAQPNGNTVAYVLGGMTKDLVLMKSTDNGNTWTKTIIIQFPYPFFNESVNAINAADAVFSNDGSISAVIDNSGMVHVFYGSASVFNEDITDGSISFYYGSTLNYWNESMGAGATPVTISSIKDENQNGQIDIVDVAPYGIGLISHPSSAIGSDGTIYVTYSSIHDYLNNGTYNYRHIYAVKSTDNGSTWTSAMDITPYNLNAENLFGSLAPQVDNNLHLVYQRDTIPGLATNNQHPFGINEIVYKAIPLSLDVIVPIANFQASDDTICVGGSVAFSNQSQYSDSYNWLFPGGTPGTSTLASPSVSYNFAGTYTAKLIAIRGQITDTLTFEIVVNDPPQAEITYSGILSICEGQSIQLNASLGDLFQWKLNGTNIQGETNQTITVSQNGNYSVLITSECGTSLSSSVYVDIIPAPAVPVITGNFSPTPNSNEIYSVPSQSGYTYTWTVNGGSINLGQGTNSISVLWGNTGQGTISMEWDNSNGCSSSTTNDVSIQLPTAQWVVLTNDVVGDGANPELLDGTQLEYMYKPWSDSLFFRVTLNSISALQSQAVGVNVMVNVPNGGNTFNFWGTDNTAAYHKLLTTWVTGNPPSSYSGTIGISDAAGVAAQNYSSLSQNNVSILVIGNTITLGLKRTDFISNAEMVGPIKIAAAVGSNVSWNDDIYDPNAELPLAIQSMETQMSDLNLYPNPNLGKFTLETTLYQNSAVEIKIHNSLGQLVFQQKEKGIAGLFKRSFDVNLINGIYFMSIQTSSGSVTKKMEIFK